MVNTYLLFVLNLTLVYAVATLGFNLLVGWSGQIGLAHAALFAVGAYGSAIAMEHGVPFLVTIPLAGIVAAPAGRGDRLPGDPAARVLPGHRDAGARHGHRRAAHGRPADVTGGGGGMSVTVWALPGITGSASTYFVTADGRRDQRSSWCVGRWSAGSAATLQAVRDLGQLSGSLGVSALRYRLIAFGLSGFIAAVAGTLYAQLQTFIFPAMFEMNLLVPMLVMVFVGGAGSLWGPLIGAAFAVDAHRDASRTSATCRPSPTASC